MPIRRIRRGPRRARLGRRKLRRTWRRNRRPKTYLHSFKRSCIVDQINVANTAVAGALTFKLSDLPNYDEFSNLFDAYRLMAVKLKFVPDFSGSPTTDAVVSIGLHSLHTAIDHNDDTQPAGVLDLMEYDTYKMKRIDRGMNRYFHVNTLASGSAGDEQNWKKWISTANTDIKYYGFKYWFDGIGQDSQVVTIDVFATYYFQCKSVI